MGTVTTVVTEESCPEAIITLARGGRIYSAEGFWVRPRVEGGKWRAATNHKPLMGTIRRLLAERDTFEEAMADLDGFALMNDLALIEFV